MTTAYQTGPGMYAATTDKVDRTIPPGAVRVHCVRLEAYDLPAKPEQHDLDAEFTIVFAMAEGNPALAKTLEGFASE